MKKTRILKVLLEAALWGFSVVVLVPLFMVFINSLKSSGEADTMSILLPDKLAFENYLEVIKTGGFFTSFFNSAAITVSTVFFTLLLSSMAGFVLSRRRTRINMFIYNLFLIGIIASVPIIPLILVLKQIHLQGGYLGMILVYIGTSLPFAVFLIYGFFSSIPRELDEAAITDGCGALTLFFKIIIPLLKPVVITLSIFIFMSTWNDFQYPFYILSSSSKKWTLPLSVYGFIGKYSTDWNLVCGHIVLVTIPVVIAYLMGQKYIISGMTAGAVKG